MANNPYDRTVIQPRERPLSSDINQLESQADYSLRFLLHHLFGRRNTTASDALVVRQGFIGEGFKVRPSNPIAMTVVVKAGLGFLDYPTGTMVDGTASILSSIGGVINVDDLSRYKPVVLIADQTFVVPAAPAGPNTRIDIIEVKPDRRLADPASRAVLDTSTGVFSPTVVNKSLTWALDGRVGSVNEPALATAAISYKVGVAANPGTVPLTTPGWVKIAEILVGSGVVSMDHDTLIDRRTYLFANGVASASISTFLSATPGTAPYNFRLSAPPGLPIYLVGGTGGDLPTFYHLYVLGTADPVAATPDNGIYNTKHVLGFPDATPLDATNIANINSVRNADGAGTAKRAGAALGHPVQHFTGFVTQQKGSSPFDFSVNLAIDTGAQISITMGS